MSARIGSALASGAVGLIVGGVVSLLFGELVCYPLIFGVNPKEFPGDALNMGLTAGGAFITTAFAFVVGSGLIPWRTRRQD